MKTLPKFPHHILTGLLAFILMTASALAAPYSGKTFDYTQPSGETFKVQLYGDEFFAYQETPDGYLVIRDKKDGFFCYAKISADGASIISTGVHVGQAKPVGLIPHQRLNTGAAMIQSIPKRNLLGVDTKGLSNEGKKLIPAKTGEILNMPIQSGANRVDPNIEDNPRIVPAPPSSNTLNKRIGLVLLASFPDRPGDVTRTVAEIDNYCNAEIYTQDGNAASVYSYFKIQSNGKLEYKNNVTAWFTAANPRSYYTDSSAGYGARAKELINEGLAALTAQGFDFTQCDGNGDGRLDGINCFYAGSRTNAWSEGLWPHQSGSYWSGLAGSGLSSSYASYQITDMPSRLSIGTFCHENGHMICNFPDLYSYDSNASEMGRYSLMSSSGRFHPNSIDPYLKIHAGWADVVDITSASQQLCALQEDRNFYYRYRNPAKPKEYFLFEVRGNTGYEGPWGGANSAVNPTKGLVIYHAIETGSNSNSTIFTADSPSANYSKPYEIMVVEANPSSNTTPWYDDPNPGSNDSFRSDGVSSISSTTLPALKFWASDGRTVASAADIRMVSSAGANMTFIVGSGPLPATPSTSVTVTTLEPKTEYGENAASQKFGVYNSGGGNLSYTITDNAAWLSCSVTSGSATTEVDDITVIYNTSNLAPGNYNATITINGSASSAGTKTINVELTVYPAPTLNASPGSISEIGKSGLVGPTTSIDLTNTGGGTAAYTISNTQAWLTMDRASGEVSIERDLVTLSFDATNLSSGTYTDTITVISPTASNSPLLIPVTFVIESTNMTVTSPNGGEAWLLDTTHDITWFSDLGGTVKIELVKAGATISPAINESTDNDGSFAWSIPSGLVAGNDYKIRITSNADPTKSDVSNQNFAITLDQLAVALDTTGITWNTDGDTVWFPQTTKTHDGVDAAQSGDIIDSQISSIEANLTGPGILTFWWKVSSENNYDHLILFIDGVEQTGSLNKISGDTGWEKKTVNIPAGNHKAKWSYEKDNSQSSGDDAAYLDEVVFTSYENFITYDGNTNDAGAPPTDSQGYTDGATAVVLPNSGNLAKSGYVFSSWNTLADGTGDTYAPGDTLNIGTTDITLYAKWISSYDEWSDGTAHDGDSNNDGISDGLAWLLGADSPAADITELLPTIDVTNTHFIFSYRRSDAAQAAAYADIAVQYSSDMSSWTEAVSSSDISITETDDFYKAGVDKVEVKIDLNLAPTGRLFGHLKLNFTNL